MKKSAALVVALCAAASIHAEDVTTSFSRCATTDNDKARLACYDKIRDSMVAAYKPDATKGAAFQAIGLTDLKVDIKGMVGKRVSVVGLIQSMGEFSMLKADVMDMTPVWVFTENLSRDDRKKLLSGCQALLCSGQFYGVVKKGHMGVGLDLQRVDWR